MGLPKQLGVKKDEDFCKRCVSSIVSMVGATSFSKDKDRFCYDLYSGIMNESDYNYLTKVDKYEYPAKLRFIPLIRPQLDYLRSEESRRPMNMRVFTTDTISIQKKEDEVLRMLMTTMHGNFMTKYLQLQNQINKIKASVQPPPQQEGQQPDPKQVQALQDKALQTAMPVDMLTQTSVFTQNDIDKIEKYMKYEYKDLVEEIMDKGMKFMIEKYSIKDKFTSGFEDKMVTDKEVYFVDWNGKDEDPQFRKVELLNFYYSGDDEAEWISECEWCAEKRFMTIPQVLDEFRDDLSSEDYEKIDMLAKNYIGMTNQYASTNGMTDRHMIDNSTDNRRNILYAGTEDYSNKVEVMFCYWQSPETIKIKQSPNKYMEDTPFTHIMKDGDVVRKDDSVKEKFKNDIYMGVIINQEVFCRLGKKPVQLRGVDKPSIVGLPYEGLAYNNYSHRPYSLVWATREIQLLYNIIHYHKELWFALSGVKGFIMDKSQIPDGMSMKEWMYQRKLGVGWIQTVREGRVQASFNQFQNYDDSISPAIQYIDSLLQNLEELARGITGVSRQRIGDIKPVERVGNTEASINQSAVVTEILFYQHDRTKRRALAKLANLCKKAWKNGKRAQYITGVFSQQILNIEPGVLDEVDMDIFVGSSYKEDQAIQQLRQVAFQDHSKNLISMGQLSKLFSIDSLKEMEHTLERYGEIAEQKAMGGQQKQQAFETQMKELDGKLRVMAEDAKMKYEQAWIDIEDKKLELEREKFKGDQEIKSRKVDSDAAVHTAKHEGDHEAKHAAVDSKNKATDSNEELKKMELKLKELEILVNANKEKEKASA